MPPAAGSSTTSSSSSSNAASSATSVAIKTSKAESFSTSSLRVNPKNKPTVTKMKQIITQVLNEKLCDEGPNAVYQADKVSALTKDIADAIKASLKAANYPRYKYLVQVVIGEQRGEGVRMGCRCFWDPDTDCYASETFSNDSLFCVATAYSVYLY